MRVASIGKRMEEQGFVLVPGVLSQTECERLIDALGPITGAGRRGLLGIRAVADLAGSVRLFDLVRPHVSAKPRPVRILYFDKQPGANWVVGWHQDLTLAVQTQADVPGFGLWSVKDGVPHVQAPAELVEKMITVRLHLDDCDETNGALRVLPGSHSQGRLSSKQIKELREQVPELFCGARAGDALLMRPLLLHASGRSKGARHRRVLHIEYAGFELPGGLEWREEG